MRNPEICGYQCGVFFELLCNQGPRVEPNDSAETANQRNRTLCREKLFSFANLIIRFSGNETLEEKSLTIMVAGPPLWILSSGRQFHISTVPLFKNSARARTINKQYNGAINRNGDGLVVLWERKCRLSRSSNALYRDYKILVLFAFKNW